MIEVDGSQYSGSGTIVRQAVAFSALTGQPVHIVNARTRRPKPGLRHQHIRVVQAIGELVNGTAEGLSPGSQEIVFRPGTLRTGRRYLWDIGTAGSTTMLGLGILPVLAFASSAVNVELRGGLFQDYAPSAFHLQHVMLPLLRRMGLEVELVMERPGYVPRGEGIVGLAVQPVRTLLRHLRIEEPGPVTRLWGIALSSHLAKRKVSERMADAAQEVLDRAGHRADIDVRYDRKSLQPGAVLALFADLGEGVRLGADQAGALRRTAEFIGKHVAKQLLEDMKTGATLDRFAADQIIPFAALAEGESRFRVAAVTDHLLTNLWLAEKFLGVRGTLNDHILSMTGVGFRREGLDA
ncbi:MAG: RNA 3'-phosphate cyclase [Nitrospirae bacterium]|nr:RNA 3'-phosphate cyclase [Nitrospirota bacterium]MBU6481122.1 RNA 3'-phosphate cyclase [Nitrospirota bacterium]MDE3041496.1 RNA 3'-phosphate cyclase [Nitrospirota bacterium]